MIIFKLCFFPLILALKMFEVFLGFIGLFALSTFFGMLIWPFYAVFFMIKMVRSSREKRKDRSMYSIGVRILFGIGRVFWWILIFEFSLFYVIYLVFRMMASGAFEKKETRNKKDDLSWIDRLEEYDTLFN